MQEKADFTKCHLIWTSWFKKKFSSELTPLAKDS